MTKELIISTVLVSPLLFTVIAILSWFMRGLRPKKLIMISKISIYLGVLIALFSSVMVYQFGILESKSIVYNGLGFSIRLDALIECIDLHYDQPHQLHSDEV